MRSSYGCRCASNSLTVFYIGVLVHLCVIYFRIGRRFALAKERKRLSDSGWCFVSKVPDLWIDGVVLLQ